MSDGENIVNQILLYRESHPEATLRYIGKKFGRTYQAVHALLSRHGLETRNCHICHTKKDTICPTCGAVKGYLAKRCRACSTRVNEWFIVPCGYCGTMLKRDKYDIDRSQSRKWFCSTSHQAYYRHGTVYQSK
jgi:hypothetical protein